MKVFNSFSFALLRQPKMEIAVTSVIKSIVERFIIYTFQKQDLRFITQIV
jgi:hypothetical protein